jgi:hypothetical protein
VIGGGVERGLKGEESIVRVVYSLKNVSQKIFKKKFYVKNSTFMFLNFNKYANT